MVLKRTLSIFLAVLMIGMTLTAFPITVNAADVDTAATEEGTVKYVGTADELKAACNEINTNGGNYTINLTGDIIGGQVNVTHKDAVVTVLGNGHTITATRSSAVYIENGGTVNLGVEDGDTKLTLSGNNDGFTHVANDEPGLIYILRGSTCNMYDKVTLTDRTGNNYFGGGVTVNGGTFHMYGGTIQSCGINGGSVCYGGGVAVFNGGNFIMENGTITDCYATSDYPVADYSRQYAAMGGGVFVTAGSTFIMNGGTISNCRATNFGGGVAVVSHNKPANGQLTSKAVINGGIISGNEALGGAGVFASGFVYAYAIPIATGAEVNGIASTGYSNATNALLGAAPSDPGLYIKGGTITDNKATGTYSNDDDLFAKGIGGGVLVYGVGTPVQIHDATISSNHADHGAGVASFYYWTNADIDGCTITGNIANGNGGGVYLANKIFKKDDNTYYLPKATIKDTTITGNSSGDRGAGVYYIADTELHISGRDVIQNNTFNGTSNNLNVLIGKKSTTGSQEELLPVYVDGDLSGSQIGLSDPRLWDDNMSDIEAPDNGAAELLTSGYKEHNPEVHPNKYFTSDHETWVVDRSVKTVIEEPDETSAYRVYTVERHPVESIGTYNNYLKRYLAPYANNTGQYEIIEIQNPQLKNQTALTQIDILNELKYRFENMNNYDVTGGVNQYNTNNIKYTFTPKSNTTLASGPLSNITIEKKPTDSRNIYLTYTAKQKVGTDQQRGGSLEFIADYRNQPYQGKLLLYINKTDYTNYLNDTYYRFSTDSTTTTTTTVDYVNSNPPNGTLYEYDIETGDINAKLIPISFKTKHTRTTTIESGTDDEVRLVRKKPDYHINNTEIDDHYDNNDIFTSYVEATGKDVKVGETIDEFYTVPEVVPTDTNSCPYIFKGWYYDRENDNDTRPVQFGTDKYAKDIYAHWIKVDNVKKDENDPTMFQDGDEDTYGGFDLAGVQIRKKMLDHNFEEVTPGGMRFITSLNMDVVNEINKIKPNNIEYGYVAATHKGWIDYHCDGVKHGSDEKLKYVSETANGIDTSSSNATNENYFGFAKNVNCTSKVTNSKNGVVRRDHQNFDKYLLYSLVITYEDAGSDKGKDVLARPYIRYKDANGLERVAYSEYTGTNVLGGCYTNYNRVADMAGN